MVNHINKYASAQAIQDALDNGTLANPYVAMTSAGTLDYNTLEPTPPAPSTMGYWEHDTQTGDYVFHITELDTDYWTYWAEIGEVTNAYYQSEVAQDLGIVLRYVSAEDYWEIHIGEDAGGSDAWSCTFSEGEASIIDSEVQVGTASDDAIVISFNGTDQFVFCVGGAASETLTINTINPPYPEAE